jgi:hypothetical protein
MLLQEIPHPLDFFGGIWTGAGVFGSLPNIDFTNWPVRWPFRPPFQYSLALYRFALAYATLGTGFFVQP